MLLVLICIVSLIPLFAIYLWLRNRLKDDEKYKKLCDTALGRGLLCIFPVMLASGSFALLLSFLKIQDTHPLLYKGLRTFIVLAFAEELVKCLMFRKVVKDNSDYACSWLDMISLMTIVSIGFSLLEAVVYAIGSNIPTILIRGICVPHAGYGYLEGYYFGKGIKKKNPFLKMFGFVVAWLIHGLYDFSLSEEFLAINDNLVFVPFILVAIDIALVIRLIIFAKKERNNPVYTEPLS